VPQQKEDAEEPGKERKGEVMIQHLVTLVKSLWSGTPAEQAVMDLGLIAFWSLARLGEITYAMREGQPNKCSKVMVKDITLSKDNSIVRKALICLKEAKTSKPGEDQTLRLLPQHHILCPVKEVLRRIQEARSPYNSLFGYYNPKEPQRNLTKGRTRRILNQVWEKAGIHGISGHSFQVGGASFWNAMGILVKEIQRLGHWESNCYKLYIRDYKPEENTTAKGPLIKLEALWRKD
jgi:hypothetical protein